MKSTLLLLLPCLASLAIQAQTLTPTVISSSGTSFVNGSTVLDYTLGEPATSTLTNGTNTLSQGFHQNDLLITAVDNKETDKGITVFPNPTADIVQVQFAKASEKNLMELFSSEGKLIFSQSENATSSSQIDMTKYASGTYLLKVTASENNNKTYQIVKTK